MRLWTAVEIIKYVLGGIISIPYDQLPGIVENLSLMEWVLPQYVRGKEAYTENMRKIVQEIKQELEGS